MNVELSLIIAETSRIGREANMNAELARSPSPIL
jgi:hypothetical protein